MLYMNFTATYNISNSKTMTFLTSVVMLPLTSPVSGAEDDTCSHPVMLVISVCVERKQTEGLCLVWHVCFVLTNNDRVVCVCLTFSADSDELIK